MRIEAVTVDSFRALRRVDIRFDGNAMLIGESGAGCSSLMQAIDRVLGAPPEQGFVQIAEQDFHADRSGERATMLSVHLVIGPSPGAAPPRLLGEAFGADVAKGARVEVRVRSRRDWNGAIETDVFLVRGKKEEPLGAERLAALRRCVPSFFLSPETFRAALRDPAQAAGIERPVDSSPPSRLLAVVRRIAALGSAASVSDVGEGLAALREVIQQRGTRPGEAAGDRSLRRRELIATVGPLPIPTIETLELTSDPEDPRAVALLTVLGVLGEIASRREAEDDAQPVLLLDNPGAGMHPRWLAALAAIVGGLPGQHITHSHSPELISWMRLETLRRLETRNGDAAVRSVDPRLISNTQARRIAHHIRRTRPGSLLARCWLLVEGESEAWLLPEFARLLGHDLRVEGVQCMEFAQAGLDIMIRLADMLGIGWVVFTDGDEAGESYTGVADSLLGKRAAAAHIVRLPAKDIERYLHQEGFARVYEKAAGRGRAERSRRRSDPGLAIRAAIKAKSKPDLAIAVLEEANKRGPDSVPERIRAAIATSVAQARGDSTT